MIAAPTDHDRQTGHGRCIMIHCTHGDWLQAERLRIAHLDRFIPCLIMGILARD
jgi:hypothetical protein